DHALDHSQGGLGLGLTLVRSIVEAHGGSVHARSEGLGRGSEFTVCLPVFSPATAKAEPNPEQGTRPGSPGRARDSAQRTIAPTLPPPSRKELSVLVRRVLVVDDHTSSAQSLAMILKLEGYEVQIAYDGQAAIEAVRNFHPEAVLMDIGLPGRDG